MTRLAECIPKAARWRMFTYHELMARDKVNLEISLLRDELLEEFANLPASDVLAAEIAEELRAALEQFDSIAQNLANGDESESPGAGPARPEET